MAISIYDDKLSLKTNLTKVTILGINLSKPNCNHPL